MNYLKKIFSTGAVRKTPHSVISKIVSLIKTGKKLSVVELGAGKGEITRAVINKIGTPRSYLAFEIDVNYCARLSAEFAQINVIEKDAFLFQEDTQQQDLIISSIPLSFYGAAKINKLLTTIQAALRPGGQFIIIFHAFWLLPALKKHFPGASIVVFPTLPLYFLLYFSNQAATRNL